MFEGSKVVRLFENVWSLFHISSLSCLEKVISTLDNYFKNFIQLQNQSFRGALYKKIGQKVLLEISQNFTGKHPCQRTCNFTSLRPATLLKKSLWHRCFSVNFSENSKNTFFYRTTPMVASAINWCIELIGWWNISFWSN